MCAEIVNLRQARKRKARAAKADTAENNRRKFGLTKAEKQTAERAKAELNRTVDGHKLSGQNGDDTPASGD
jgi:hypothetical protein